jgi:hypothetical protein|tara:strand:- start:741 stop:1013 length:273 start_codon:yes stop_codon:yes gene_type:complete
MKELFLIIALLTPTLGLASTYVAEKNTEGKYCARVAMKVGTTTFKKYKCRTISEWKKAGYTVNKFIYPTPAGLDMMMANAPIIYFNDVKI